MAKKETAEEVVRILQFKDGSKNWWLGYLHYTILDGKLFFAAGGIDTEESREKMTKYLKTKKLL